MENEQRDIVITRASGRIGITLRAVFMGRDLCVMITGGDTPHLGALTAVSNNQAPETIVFGAHKEHFVTEMAAGRLQTVLAGGGDRRAVVCCGIHLDNIEKREIDAVMALAGDMTEELCRRLDGGAGT